MRVRVDIPQSILDATARRARALCISRNRLIVRALERELAVTGDWTPGFLEALTTVDDATARVLDATIRAVRARRRSKHAPAL
jgi:hypothetical protein